MIISNDIHYIGVNDHQLDLFEGQYIIPNGMAYNSYVILDRKIAVMDTVDSHFFQEWFHHLQQELKDLQPDYLIVSHMEPDHSANILSFMEVYPNTTIVSSAKAFQLMDQFYGNDFSAHRIIVSDGDQLSLGKHNLSFITAPMVHWPEVMLTYDHTDKVLFSADAFGKFGALDVMEDWACEARRYYFGIIGKYGSPVQTLLKKLTSLDIRVICPLHGNVLNENLSYYINLYDTWSSYLPESRGITIAYTSIYGNTKKAVQMLEDRLIANGCQNVKVYDLARDDISEAVEDAFKHSKLVLATTTYNGDIFPFMRNFIEHLTERLYQNRAIALIENGSWAPVAAKKIKGMFEHSKNITFLTPVVSITSAPNDFSMLQIDELANVLCNEIQ